jgi:hypothetical protein
MCSVGKNKSGSRIAARFVCGLGAVHFYTPLSRTGEQILTDEEKSKGLGFFRNDGCATTPKKQK